MISRPLPRVRDGDVLSLGLVNQMIGRVEYASNLLKKNNPIAGLNISVSQNSLGSKIAAALGAGISEGVNDWGALLGEVQVNYFTSIIYVVKDGILYEINSSYITKNYFVVQRPYAYGMYKDRICGFFNARIGENNNDIGFIYNYITKDVQYFDFSSGGPGDNSTVILGIYKENYFGTSYSFNFGNYYFTSFGQKYYEDISSSEIHLTDIYESTFVGYRRTYVPFPAFIDNLWVNGTNILSPGFQYRAHGIGFNNLIIGSDRILPYPTFSYINSQFYSPAETLFNFGISGTVQVNVGSILNQTKIGAKYLQIEISGNPDYPEPFYFYNYITNKIVKPIFPEGYPLSIDSNTIRYIDKSL